jgi:phosphoribosylanthranilate isomerase
LNTTESVIVDTDREEVLERIQRGFENQFQIYGKLERKDIKALDYDTLQAWKKLQRHIISES